MNNNDASGFNVGDPVRLIGGVGMLGKITAFATPITYSTGLVIMPYVVFPGSPMAQAHIGSALRICKCATRIPKGVSKC